MARALNSTVVLLGQTFPGWELKFSKLFSALNKWIIIYSTFCFKGIISFSDMVYLESLLNYILFKHCPGCWILKIAFYSNGKQFLFWYFTLSGKIRSKSDCDQQWFWVKSVTKIALRRIYQNMKRPLRFCSQATKDVHTVWDKPGHLSVLP